MNFVDKDGTTKVYIPVHPWITRHKLFWLKKKQIQLSDASGKRKWKNMHTEEEMASTDLKEVA